MSSSPQLTEQQEARRMILWLTFECTLGGNPTDCPGYPIRLLPFDERRSWVDSLSDDQCVEFYQRHVRCQCAKEALLKVRKARGQA